MIETIYLKSVLALKSRLGNNFQEEKMSKYTSVVGKLDPI
jgi:hypothetical protein